MENKDFEFDFDAILAEFNSYSSDYAGAAEAEDVPPVPEQDREELQEENYLGDGEYYVDTSLLTGWLAQQDALGKTKRSSTARPQPEKPGRKSAVAPRREEEFSPRFTPEGRDYTRPEPKPKKKSPPPRKPVEVDPDKVLSDTEMEKAEELLSKAEEKQARRQAEKSAIRRWEQDEEIERERAVEKRERSSSPLKVIIATLFALVGLFALVWVGGNVHPDSGTVTAAAVKTRMELPSRLDMYMHNAASDALSEVSYIKKIYTLPEIGPGPMPDMSAFGTTTDPAVISAVIAEAEELLEGQKTVWQPDLPFYPGTEMHYYRDDTILVIVWKEIVEERCATLAEIKIAHGSQFRRRLAEDTYGSSVQFYASEMAEASNAVVASNADFYAFRNIGVTVYQRQLFRNVPDRLDTCFVTAGGDMLFARAGELTDDASVLSFIEQNDVVFSLSFGPVLVDNGEVQYCESYPIGEIDTQYSRAGLGMTDELHYLLMTVNHTDGRPRAKVNDFARLMQIKGCVKAYNLDGGQTSEIVIQGEPVNYIDFGAERTVSDIIYFASAIPESEVYG